jgi:low affinity Fe/Cu permease
MIFRRKFSKTFQENFERLSLKISHQIRIKFTTDCHHRSDVITVNHNNHKEAKQLIQNVFNKMKAKMKENDRKRFNKDSFEKNFESALINTFDRH